MSAQITQQKLAELVGGTLVQGDPATPLHGLNSVAEAAPGEITFLGNPRYLPQLKRTQASCVIVAPGFNPDDAPSGVGLIEVENPTLAFSSVIRQFAPPARSFAAGVHPSAIIASSVVFDPQKVSIGPGVIVEDAVSIGDGTVIHAVYLSAQALVLGALASFIPTSRSRIIPSAEIESKFTVALSSARTVLVMNSPRMVTKRLSKVGIVQIDDDVEIGSCTTIDRARFGRTWIGEGTKIDNLVQIGHNCIVGKHCIIVSQTGISGSTRIGDRVTIGGQVGVAGHLEIGSKVLLLAKSGVTKSIKEPGA